MLFDVIKLATYSIIINIFQLNILVWIFLHHFYYTQFDDWCSNYCLIVKFVIGMICPSSVYTIFYNATWEIHIQELTQTSQVFQDMAISPSQNKAEPAMTKLLHWKSNF